MKTYNRKVSKVTADSAAAAFPEIITDAHCLFPLSLIFTSVWPTSAGITGIPAGVIPSLGTLILTVRP